MFEAETDDLYDVEGEDVLLCYDDFREWNFLIFGAFAAVFAISIQVALLKIMVA